MTGNQEYLLDNRQVEAEQRFDAPSELFQPLDISARASGWA